MADAQTTPGSSTTTAKTPAVKDKECQYCHQAFTSSSLGRHLDLYIKDKNAKPPDELHDVEEIRRLRGNVTRRQARTSSGKREGSTPSNSKPTPLRDQRSPSTQGGNPNSHPQRQHPDGGPIRTYLNKANWQSTGVINELPSLANHSSYARKGSPSRRVSVKEEIIHKQNALEERDRVQAAELALREVLDNVKAANSRAHPPIPFDFNFFNLSFPELCLQCLSPPQCLLSNPAVPIPNSWSIDAPKLAHYESLRNAVEEKLRNWQRLRQLQSGPNSNRQPNGTNGHFHERGNFEIMAAMEEYRKHLETAYDTWKTTSDKKKQDIWLIECAKAFAREREKHNEAKHRLDLAEQKLQLLSAQLAQKYPSPENPVYQPSFLPVSRETIEQLPNSDFFSYDGLLSRWKTRIQANRSMQQPLPPPSPWATATPPNLNNNHTNGATYTQRKHQSDQRPSHSNGAESLTDEDEDLADAPGDEDDSGQHNGMDKGMLDPTLRHAEADGERQAGGRMLLGLREYDGSGGGNGNGNAAMDMGRG